MDYKENQVINARNRYGKIVTGVVLEKCEYPDHWWVRMEQDGRPEVTIFSVSDLDMWNMEEKSCVCGATSTYYPAPPSGHAYYCELRAF